MILKIIKIVTKNFQTTPPNTQKTGKTSPNSRRRDTTKGTTDTTTTKLTTQKRTITRKTTRTEGKFYK